MGRKKTLNLSVSEELLDEFNAVCAQYGHAKQKGMVLSAAVLMFLRSDPHTQGRFLEQVLKADISEGVEKMLVRAKTEQALAVKTQEAIKRAGAEGTGTLKLTPRPRQAPREEGRQESRQGPHRGQEAAETRRLSVLIKTPSKNSAIAENSRLRFRETV